MFEYLRGGALCTKYKCHSFDNDAESWLHSVGKRIGGLKNEDVIYNQSTQFYN